MPSLGICQLAIVLTALTLLLTTLGLSIVAGLRAYIPVLVIAAGPFVPTACGGHLLSLSRPFQAPTGQESPWMLVTVLAAVALGVFVVDKVLGLDHVSDAVHTVVRPLAGAVVMMGLSIPVSECSPVGAAVMRAGHAVSVHAVKAGVHLPVTAVSLGLLNPVVSVVEDVIVFALTSVSLAAPIPIVVVLLLLALASFFLGQWVPRALRRRLGRPHPSLAGVRVRTGLPRGLMGYRSSSAPSRQSLARVG